MNKTENNKEVTLTKDIIEKLESLPDRRKITEETKSLALKALRAYAGKKSIIGIADTLNIDKNILYKLCRKHGIEY